MCHTPCTWHWDQVSAKVGDEGEQGVGEGVRGLRERAECEGLREEEG